MFKKPQKPCNKCDRCVELTELGKILSEKGTAQLCSASHLPQFLIKKIKKNYKKFYSDDQGI